MKSQLYNVHQCTHPSVLEGAALASTREVVAEQLQGDNLAKLKDSHQAVQQWISAGKPSDVKS